VIEIAAIGPACSGFDGEKMIIVHQVSLGKKHSNHSERKRQKQNSPEWV
jgi:hypothetical protein